MVTPQNNNVPAAPKREEEPKAKSVMMAIQTYVGRIAYGLESLIGNMDKYQAVCGYNILAQINVQLAKEGLNFKSPIVDKETINNAIKYAIIYRLNTDNRELFAIVRKENRGSREKPNYVRVIEVKPQYRGTLKIVSDFGRDVKKVYPEWIVREGDEFTFPTFKGIDIIPPTWTRKDMNGKIVRVVVPILYKDGTVDYRIAERESVATNIKAQIKQSLMGKDKREEILAKIQDMSLDALLSDKTILPLVNDTYTGISQEEMIITKLVINAVKRVQIDYNSALARELNEKTFDNADVYKKTHNAEELLNMSGAPMIDMKEVETEPAKPEEPKTEREIDEDGVVQELQPDTDPSSLFPEEDQ